MGVTHATGYDGFILRYENVVADFLISYHSSDRPWAEWIAWVRQRWIFAGVGDPRYGRGDRYPPSTGEAWLELSGAGVGSREPSIAASWPLDPRSPWSSV